MTRPAQRTESQPYPWVVPDLFRWFFLMLTSVAGLVIAWWGESGTARLSTQIAYLNVGVVAIVLGGLGNFTWLVQGRRALALRRRELLASIPMAALPTPLVAYPTSDEPRVAVPGATLHHRPSCPAVAGKRTEERSVAQHEKAGRRPCGLCSGVPTP